MLNKIMLIGRVGKDPEVKHIQSGDSVANFNLATSKNYKNKDGEKVESTTWHNIVVWKKLAEIVEKYVKKGDLLYVEGEITTRSYDDKDGNKRYVTEIIANELRMLSKKFTESTSQQSLSNDEPKDLNGDKPLPF